MFGNGYSVIFERKC